MRFEDLNSPYSVTGVGDFPIDIDDDRNYGEYEDNDGDDITSQDEIFDLAFVSTHDGIVIIDVTDSSTPKKMDFIPIQVGKVEVDRERRMVRNWGQTFKLH
jgi:hypothetical protein